MEFEDLIEQAHQDANAIRAEHGHPPIAFQKPNGNAEICPGFGSKQGLCVNPKKSAGFCKNCYQLKRYHERKASGNPIHRSSAKKQNLPPNMKVSTDDFAGLVRVLDTQIAAVQAKLDKLRMARQTIASL